MLQAINLHSGRGHFPSHNYTRSSPKRYNSTKSPKPELARKYVNLHFKEDDRTFGRNTPKKGVSLDQKEDVFYRTFHPKEKGKSNRNPAFYSRRQTGRETALSERATIVGTPFASLDANNEPDIPLPVLPSLDRERYKYLLTVVAGNNRIKRLSDFKGGSKSVAIPSSNAGKPKEECESPTAKQAGSPNIINLSVNFDSSANASFLGETENSYQKMFKNKQLLQKGRYSSFRENMAKQPGVCLLADDQLRVKQATFENRKNRRRLAV